MVSKRNLLFQRSIFRCYVSFREWNRSSFDLISGWCILGVVSWLAINKVDTKRWVIAGIIKWNLFWGGSKSKSMMIFKGLVASLGWHPAWNKSKSHLKKITLLSPKRKDRLQHHRVFPGVNFVSFWEGIFCILLMLSGSLGCQEVWRFSLESA